MPLLLAYLNAGRPQYTLVTASQFRQWKEYEHTVGHDIMHSVV